MNISNELILIATYLSGRLLFYDLNNIFGSNKNKGLIKRLLWGLIILFLKNDIIISLLILSAYIIIVLFDSLYINPNKKDKLIFYFFHSLFAIIVMPAIIRVINIDFIILENTLNQILLFIIEKLRINKSYIINSNYIIAIFCGFIFILKEGTIIIRLVLARMSAVPKKKDEPGHKDNKEYDRGKLIGILERSLIYFLILVNQVAAVAIIIALKSIARFKELDDKNFAEYFLIGSLLSICVAIVPALILRLLFK